MGNENVALDLWEIVATYVELVFLFCYYELFFVPRSMSKKVFLMKKHGLIILLTVSVTIANMISIFSYLTFYLCVITDACVALSIFKAPIISFKQNSILTVTTLYYFGVLFLEYFLVSFLTILLDISTVSGLVFSPDNYRTFFVIITKTVFVIIYFILSKVLAGRYLRLKSQYAFYIAAVTMFLGTLMIAINIALMDSYLLSHKYVYLSISALFLVIYLGMFWMAISFTKMSEVNGNMKISGLKFDNMQKELETLTRLDVSKSKILHDTKNHLLIIQQLIKDNQIEALNGYIQKYMTNLDQVHRYVKTGFDSMDVFLNHRITEAKQKGILIECNVPKLENVSFDPIEMCTIITNLLDNAIEACDKLLANVPKLIQIEIKKKHAFLHIKISNTVQKPPKFINGLMETTKKDSEIHGFGLQIVSECVQRHMGELSFSYDEENSAFTVFVTLCLDAI